MIGSTLDKIPEDTPEKAARLSAMIDAETSNNLPVEFEAQKRWIGAPKYSRGK